MNEGQAKRKAIENENISTADSAAKREAEIAESEATQGTPQPGASQTLLTQEHSVAAVEVKSKDITAQAIPTEPAGSSASPSQTPVDGEHAPLFASQEAANLRSKWDAIQVSFVDEPRGSVQRADSLVAAAMQRLAEQFAAERSNLESQWSRGSDVSTEDLRIALRRYRSFFGRLLSV